MGFFMFVPLKCENIKLMERLIQGCTNLYVIGHAEASSKWFDFCFLCNVSILEVVSKRVPHPFRQKRFAFDPML